MNQENTCLKLLSMMAKNLRAQADILQSYAERTHQPQDYAAKNFALQLYSELSDAKNEIARLNGQTHWQCSCGGTDCKGQEENDKLRAENAELRKDKERLVSWMLEQVATFHACTTGDCQHQNKSDCVDGFMAGFNEARRPAIDAAK